jgi:hypothetical protein
MGNSKLPFLTDMEGSLVSSELKSGVQSSDQVVSRFKRKISENIEKKRYK